MPQAINEMNDEQQITWTQLKDKGTSHYESCNFQEATKCWTQAYERLTAIQGLIDTTNQQQTNQQTVDMSSRNILPTTSTQLFYQKERQYLLSNLVACKLHILHQCMADEEGRTPPTYDDESSVFLLSLAQSIVVLAKECIQLDDKWSKGYIRLASAYISFDSLLIKSSQQEDGRRQHSNDACIALQTALRLDPSNRLARNMLVQELSRRDRREQSQQNPSSSSSSGNESSKILNHNLQQEDIDKTPNALSWYQRLKLEIQVWLQRHPFFTTHDARDIYIVLFILLLLYLSFDGRFGFDSFNHTITTNTPSTTKERIHIPQSRVTNHRRTKWEPETATLSFQYKNKKYQHSMEQDKNHHHHVQNSVVPPLYIPLLLMILTTLIFLNPTVILRRRFPFFRDGRGNEYTFLNLVFIASLILFLLLIPLLFQQQLLFGNPPIVINRFVGPLGFLGGMRMMRIHIGPFGY